MCFFSFFFCFSSLKSPLRKAQSRCFGDHRPMSAIFSCCRPSTLQCKFFHTCVSKVLVKSNTAVNVVPHPCQGFITPPPPHIYGGEVYWNDSVHLSVCHPVHESNCVHTISPEPCNLFFYQTWYGGVLSWGDVSWLKTGSLSLLSRSQQGLISSKYDYFYCGSFWLYLKTPGNRRRWEGGCLTLHDKSN